MHYRREMPVSSYFLSVEPGKAMTWAERVVTIDGDVLDQIATYQTSVPTAPSAGRVYKRCYSGVWYVYFVVDEPGTGGVTQMHVPFKAEVLRAP